MAVAVETPEQAQSDTSNARSALKVVLAILIAAEALWAVAFALAKTGSDLSLPALMSELHLHYILPLALVGDVIVLVPACVITPKPEPIRLKIVLPGVDFLSFSRSGSSEAFHSPDTALPSVAR